MFWNARVPPCLIRRVWRNPSIEQVKWINLARQFWSTVLERLLKAVKVLTKPSAFSMIKSLSFALLIKIFLSSQAEAAEASSSVSWNLSFFSKSCTSQFIFPNKHPRSPMWRTADLNHCNIRTLYTDYNSSMCLPQSR